MRGRSFRAAAGEKNTFSALRHSRYSGGSISSGIPRKEEGGTTVPCGLPGLLGSSCSEENSCG